MTLRRALIDAADRGVGRHALASLSTRRAAAAPLDIEILYDRAWVHRIDSTYIPVSDRFEYGRDWNSTLATIFDPIRENWLFLYEPREGDTIVDIGAGDGLDSVVFSNAVGPSGRVLAVEAHPATFVLLEQACRLNGLSNVTPVQCAVMDAPGSATMVEDGSHRDLYTVLGGTNGARRTGEVPARRSTSSAASTKSSASIAQDEHRRRRAARIPRAEKRWGARATCASPVILPIGNRCRARDEGLRRRVPARPWPRANPPWDDPRPWVRDHVHGLRGAKPALTWTFGERQRSALPSNGNAPLLRRTLLGSRRPFRRPAGPGWRPCS